jgi:hypothetical protein
VRHARPGRLEAGAKSFRFSFEESISDTMSLARRAGAAPCGTRIKFSRALPEP